MAQTLKITVTAVPKLLTRQFINVKKIISDGKTVEFLEKMKPFLFGTDTISAAQALNLDLFTLLFINDKPFLIYIRKYIEGIKEGEIGIAQTGMLVNLLYRGKAVRLIPLHREKNEILVNDSILLRLNIIDTGVDYNSVNIRLLRASEKNAKKSFNPDSGNGRHYIDTIHLAVASFYMKQAISEKELMDKVNFRRFNAHLQLNNRYISPEKATEVFKRKKDSYPDISDLNERQNLFELFAVACRGVSVEELFSVERVFTVGENNEDYSRIASDFLDLIYNGNGVEITDIFVKMAQALADWKMPRLDSVDLIEIRKNYIQFYGGTALAYSFDHALCNNEKMKNLMRKRMITNYWNIYEKILKLKQYSSIITLCHTLADLDANKYRDNFEYEERLVLAFGEAERAISEKKEMKGY